MTKILKSIRNILKSLGHKAKVSISIALTIPWLLSFKITYQKTLSEPEKPDGK